MALCDIEGGPSGVRDHIAIPYWWSRPCVAMDMDMREFASMLERQVIKKVRNKLAGTPQKNRIFVQEFPQHLIDRIPDGEPKTFHHGGGGNRGDLSREATVAYLYLTFCVAAEVRSCPSCVSVCPVFSRSSIFQQRQATLDGGEVTCAPRGHCGGGDGQAGGGGWPLRCICLWAPLRILVFLTGIGANSEMVQSFTAQPSEGHGPPCSSKQMAPMHCQFPRTDARTDSSLR
eukprot:gene17833-biopygen7274